MTRNGSIKLPGITVLGAGHVGPVIARVAVQAGYQVSIAASGDPEKIELIAQVLAPGAESGPFPAWIGVGGSPQSVIRAAHYGFSLMLAIIGGSPARFAPFSQLFQQALERFGRAPLPVGVHSPGHVAATDEEAREEFWPRYLEVIRSVSKIRGFAIPTKESFLYEVGPHGALYVGSPETVAQKIAANLTALGATRFDLKYSMGGLAHHVLMTNIELYGTQVIPRVRELLDR
jgi:alkanesulfonate monooxygenase SsuD/methylene tetrahydromethanopterin reductase-like flavin-dependent oxidoreductase (luciferase family)